VRGVLEIRAAQLVVKRRRVSRKIRFDEIEIAVEIVIGSGDAHAGLRLSIGAEGAAGFDRDVRESTVLFVLIESAGGGIVGNINVRPAIVVEIGSEHAETVGAVSFKDAGFFTDVAECSVAVIVIKNVFATIESGWATRDHDAFVEARTGFGDRRGLQVKIDVVGNKEVQAAIAIVVYESTASVPALTVSGDASFFADIRKGAIAVVAVENIFAEVSDEKIVEAVVIV